MYHTVVMTCGTSFNFPRNFFSLQQMFDEGDERKELNLHGVEQSETEQKYIDEWLERCRFLLRENQNYDPEKVSAEYSTLHALHQNGELAKKPNVILFLTKTTGGLMAAKLFEILFSHDFSARVEPRFVDMDVSQAATLNRTIGHFMDQLSTALQQGEPRSTCFAPLGGYKVMTSYGYIVGSLLKYETIYINDYSQQLVKIPWVPIHMDTDFVDRYGELFRRCYQRDVCLTNEFSEREQYLFQKHPYFFELEENLVSLTPLAVYLLQESDRKHLLDTRFYASKQVVDTLKRHANLKAFSIEQFQNLTKKLREGHAQEELVHEKSFEPVDQKKVRFHLYKGSSNYKVAVFRLAYRYDKENDELYANYLWFDHEQYEKEAAKGIGLYQEEKGFQEITDEILQKRAVRS